MMPAKEILYRAVAEKDIRYDGIFYYGVKTTGIFFRPSCKAKKPKIANIIFNETADEAVQSGYRPCKLCRL